MRDGGLYRRVGGTCVGCSRTIGVGILTAPCGLRVDPFLCAHTRFGVALVARRIAGVVITRATLAGRVLTY
jgi:hypothetical protein